MGKFLKWVLDLCLSRLPVQGLIVGNHTQGTLAVREEIEALGTYLEFIDHDQLSKRVKKKGRPFCLLTFDDGKKITADEAAVALEQAGVPAVFYAITDAASTGSPVWFDRRNAIIKYLEKVPEDLMPHHIKGLPLEDINSLLDTYFSSYPIDLDLKDPCVASMSWTALRALDRKGFTIGAHTVHHPILINESREYAAWEIKTSIAEVTAHLGHPCASFAFPNGSHTRDLARYAMGCGVETVMTTIPTWVGRRQPAWRLPRVDIYNHYDKNKIWLKVSAAVPGIFLRNPDGTGRQYVMEKWFGG